MMMVLLATIIGFTGSNDTTIQEVDSYTIQASYDSQKLIRKLYRNVEKNRMKGQYTLTYLDGSTPEWIGADGLPPGTLLFVGSSEEDIQGVILCLNDGQCTQILSQEGSSKLNICELTSLDLSPFSFQALYQTTEVSSYDKSQVHDVLAKLQFEDQSTQLSEANSPQMETSIVDVCVGDSVEEEPQIKSSLSSLGSLDFVNDEVNGYFVNREMFPFVLSPKSQDITLENFKIWAEIHQQELKSYIDSAGGILLRDFPINSADDFGAIVRTITGRELIDYKGEGSRKRITQGVYTSTEAPPEFKIPLHNELSCTLNPVDYICFYCEIAPDPGSGETILAKTEDVTREIMKKPHIWNMFYGKTLNYITHHPSEGNFFSRVNPTHKTWPQAFETTDKDEVARICERKGYECEWTGDWIEVIRHVPATQGPDEYFDHPYWFNQAYLYHGNPRIRNGWVNHLMANLLYIAPSTRQYEIEFEDETEIPKDVVYEIYDALDGVTVKFDWQERDLLLLHNRKACHGRNPYVGQRRILASMVQ